MRNTVLLLLLVSTIGLSACKTSKKPEPHKQTDSSASQEEVHTQTDAFDCNKLYDPEFVYEIAKSAINKHDNEHIWNLSEVNTEDFFTAEDYFTNTKTKDRLVLMSGDAGGSAGTANNLLMLLSCAADTFKIVWAEQASKLGSKDIRDLNNDGIKEIVSRSSMTWMGECSDQYTIFNFKNGRKNTLYVANSFSVIGCGKDNLSESYQKGDTLESIFDCLPIKSDGGKYIIRQIRTTKIHDGGRSDEEIAENLKVVVDTTDVNLK